jgi:hypothetical protein
MDPELNSENIKNKYERKIKKKLKFFNVIIWVFLQSDGFRHTILHDISTNKFLCNYNFYFLPIISILLWSLFLFF